MKRTEKQKEPEKQLEKQPEETKEKRAEKAQAVTLVYCGPSIRNVARQYTVYCGGKLPGALRAFLDKNPEARGLLVPVERFAETRKRLEVRGTAEAVLFEKVKSKL